jgi:hypothetical protein
VTSPSLVVPLKNSTLVTWPSTSAAVAASGIVTGKVKLAPSDGDVSDTVGGWFGGGGGGCGGGGPAGSRLTIFATDGTPAESTMKSM